MDDSENKKTEKGKSGKEKPKSCNSGKEEFEQGQFWKGNS